jgi:hypothetical protein
MKKMMCALVLVCGFFPAILGAQGNQEALVAEPLPATVSEAHWGAAAAKLDANPQLEDMLRYAIEDEYLAHAEYVAILAKFGTQRPFSNIVEAEVQHIASLSNTYAAHGLVVPEDKGADYVKIPKTIKEALETGVQAEIDNIAMYDAFLKDKLMTQSANADIRALFVSLRDASKNHLGAFQNALARYK